MTDRSDTPLVDAVTTTIRTPDKPHPQKWVPADFARQLERELSEAQSTIEGLRNPPSYRKMDMTDADYIASLERELAEAREEMNQQERKLRKQFDRELGCELRDPYGTIWEQCQAQDKQLADLRRDRERLDWLDNDCEVIVSTATAGVELFGHNKFLSDGLCNLRQAIDAAMGETTNQGEQ